MSNFLLQKEIAEDLSAWVTARKKLLKDQSEQDILDWLSVKKPHSEVKLIPMYFEDISKWHLGSFSASDTEDQLNLHHLALSTRAAISEFLFEIPLYDFYPRNLGRYSLRNYGLFLSQVIATGWIDQAELVARHGFKELNRLMDRGISYGLMGWFMLELGKDWLNANVSLDSEFRQHEIENLGIWDKLLAGWRNSDAKAFDALMSEMADYHLSQSKHTMNDDDFYEFGFMSYWLFPVELLAVLRLREWEGIPNPPLSHPLFHATPFARLYPPPAWPKDEILDQAEAKFRAAYPNTPSVADLPALRAEQA